jgi:hypothetical protein
MPMFELNDIALCLALLAGAYWWWRAHAVKEVALRIVRGHCQSLEVQLLDESVVLSGFWLKHDASGTLRVRRSYTFEFTSTGDERYHGCVVMLGTSIESIQLEPHRLN